MPKWTEEQQLAIDQEHSDIIVSAGAGSGKTAVLTSRVIRKLKEHVNIDHLLILTFTKKAAHEMKERIRVAISKDDSLKDQLDYIDGSYITTFDSFALSIVKKYSYLLNVSKNVKIVDPSIIHLEKKRILDEIFDYFYETKNSNFLSLIDSFCVKDDQDMKQYILDINDKLDLKYDKSVFLRNYISSYYDKEHLSSLLQEYLDLIFREIQKVDSLLDQFSNLVDMDYFLAVKDILNPLLASQSYEEVKSSLSFRLPNLPRGSSEDAKSVKEEMGTIFDYLQELTRFSSSEDLLNTLSCTSSYVEAILSAITMLDERVQLFKEKNNMYEFTDISKMAIRVLKEHEDIREELKNFFQEIMIDEYQDTSDLQEAFISMIDRDNVYMVGDIKQSIYRFRNANPYLFKTKYDRYSSHDGGFKIDLTKNFRSRNEVVDNINQIFSRLMTDELGGADYRSTHQMVFGNTAYVEKGNTNTNHHMEIHHYDYDKTSIYSKEEIEIFFIASDIKQKVENHYQVFDKDRLTLRDATYRDFAILLDKSLHFDLYKKIFEYLNIPMTKFTTTNITNEVEIVLIKNILALILHEKEHCYDVDFRYAFVSIARSYLFSYDDDTIFTIIKEGTFRDSELMKIVSTIASSSNSLSLKECIYCILEKFDFYLKMIQVGDVRNRTHRIAAIIDIFDQLASMGYDLYQTYSYLEELLEDGYEWKIEEVDAMDDSVKIMTIHASKGLEFPVCYFASLHSKFNIRELNEKFLYHNTYGIITPYFQEGIGKTFVKDLVKDDYLREEISEKIRLFYVALTRAREKMIVVTSFDPKKNVTNLASSRSFLDMLTYIREDLEKYMVNLDLQTLELTKDYNSIKKYNYQDNIESCSSFLEFRELSVSSEILSKKKISKETLELIDQKARDTLQFGKYIHQILECLDFQNPEVDSLSISDFYKEKIRSFLKKLDFASVVHIYKEYEFVYLEGDTLEHGKIDLMLEYPERIDIIDYKLKDTEDANYKRQLQSYQRYVSSQTQKEVRVYLFSIIDGVLKEL